MPRTNPFAAVELAVAEETRTAAVLDPEEPFRILVVGDFSAGVGRFRRPIPIDRDNFDAVLERIAPDLSVPLAGEPQTISFRSLDDFHPDRLVERIPQFRAPSVPDAELLRRMMSDQPASGASPTADRSPLLRSLMHRAEFQALESAWRGVHFLARRLSTGEELQLLVMDLPLEELSTGAALGDLARALEEGQMAVMAGLYQFGKIDEAALTRLGALAESANVPFVAALAPDAIASETAFASLRRSLAARWLGLALPRFLLRLPYGARTDEIDSFAFEEMPALPQHERYLWGNPAIACAYLLGEAFTRHGWRMHPGLVQDVEGLPAHVYQVDGASELKPCAEILLTESEAARLLEAGFMPLASIKGTDRARLVRFQSIAKPAAPLAGKWE